MEEPTESQDPYSYFAYFMDLGLSNKSPYSAVYNPNVHMFVHVFGSILGRLRSLNARDIEGREISNTLINAIYVEYAQLHSAELGEFFMEEGSTKTEIKSGLARIDGMPPNKSPVRWLIYAKDQGCSPTYIMYVSVLNMFISHESLRERTIGKWLFTYAKGKIVEMKSIYDSQRLPIKAAPTESSDSENGNEGE